ncbi:MAG: hypothetical protein ACREI2_09705 [Nitrospiraceae bacterium]
MQFRKRGWSWSVLAVPLASFLAIGCASPRPEMIIHESQRGSVYLERASERSFQAAHPIKLDPSLIARVLRGVQLQERKGTIQMMLTSHPKMIRAFSDEDVTFLAPLMATAFSQAASDQQVGFRLTYPATGRSLSGGVGAGVGSSDPPVNSLGPETTSGTVYVYGLSLYLTLTQFRHVPERADTINMANRQLPDPTGLDRYQVLFVPEMALRPDSYKQSWLLGEPTLTTLIIDYELLAKLPATQLEPGMVPPTASQEAKPRPTEATQPSPSAQRGLVKPAEGEAVPSEDLRSMKELVIKKDMELEALKEELRSLRRQLTEREAELQKPKEKKKPAPHSQEPSP